MAYSKKKTEKLLENFSDSSDASSPELECDICNVCYTDPKAYENHVSGKKHNKKIKELKLKAKKKSKEDVSEDSEDSEDEMHCDVCDKNFTGYISYTAHIKGTLHAKNKKKLKMKKEQDDMPEVIKRDSEEEDDEFIPKVYAKCSTCNKEFGGPESFKMHLNSATHKKKVNQAKAMEDLKKNEGEHSDGEEIYAKCRVCKKSFTGVVPYKIHMQSNTHNKNVERQKITEYIKEFCSNTDFTMGFICKECKKTFMDPFAFKCHLENNSHEKYKAKNAISEFLKTYPEIEFYVPYDKPGSGEGSEAEESNSYYLVCNLCHVCFTGPESAQDHVKSKKHINLKKEKKMKLLLKEKKKNSSETPEDKTSKKSTSTNKLIPEGKQNSASKNGHDVDEFELI